MTTTSIVPKFNLPTQPITPEELSRTVSKPQSVRKMTRVTPPPPSIELMTELRDLLKQLHPDDPHPKRTWMRVVIIIHYETAGHPDGFALADAWSRRGRRYTGPAGVRKFWKGMKPCPKDPLTIRTLHWMVDQKSEGF